jgi:hypothetical protein
MSKTEIIFGENRDLVSNKYSAEETTQRILDRKSDHVQDLVKSVSFKFLFNVSPPSHDIFNSNITLKLITAIKRGESFCFLRYDSTNDVTKFFGRAILPHISYVLANHNKPSEIHLCIPEEVLPLFVSEKGKTIPLVVEFMGEKFSHLFVYRIVYEWNDLRGAVGFEEPKPEPKPELKRKRKHQGRRNNRRKILITPPLTPPLTSELQEREHVCDNSCQV